MPYGTIKVDTITFTDAGVDKSVSISGLVQNPTFTGNVTATGTIFGLIVQAPTVTGTTANFASGVYTTQISGAIVKVPAGSAGAPSIQVGVGASVAPGLYGAGTDLLGISTGGAGRIFIDSTGRLGVGTSSPTARLDLGAPGNVNFFQASNGVNSTLRFTFASNLTTIGNAGGTAGLALETNGSERLRIDSAGNVGIGTSSPQEKLHIEGAGRQSLRINNTTPGSAVSPELTTIDFYGWSSQPKARIEAQDQAINFNGGWLALSTANTSNVLTRALTIDNSQRVGIGTSSPGAILHTVNTSAGAATIGAFIQNSSLTAGTEVRLGFAPNTNLVSDNRYSWIGAVNTGGSNDSSLTFATTPGGTPATERLRIDSSGQLIVAAKANGITNGIIYNVPYTGGQANGVSQALQVATGGAANVLARINMSTVDLALNNSSFISFATSPGGAGAPSGDLTTERMRISPAGNVGIGTSSPSIVYRTTINGDGSSIVGGLSLQNNGTETLTIGNVTAANNVDSEIWNPRNGYLRFATNNTERLRIDNSGNVGIGTSSPSTLLDVNSDTVRLRTARTPASATATGTAGEICWDANYIYVCTATDTWRRTALSSW
jgi:hypothetical protein